MSNTNNEQEKKEMIAALSVTTKPTLTELKDKHNSLVIYAVSWVFELRERSHDFKDFRQTAENFFKFMINSHDEMKESYKELKSAQEENTRAATEISATARTSLLWLKWLGSIGLIGWAADSGILDSVAEFIKGVAQ